MFKMLTNLTKAAVAVAVTPITIAADIVMLPADASEINKPAFSRTGDMLKAAKKSIDEAVE